MNASLLQSVRDLVEIGQAWRARSRLNEPAALAEAVMASIHVDAVCRPVLAVGLGPPGAVAAAVRCTFGVDAVQCRPLRQF